MAGMCVRLRVRHGAPAHSFPCIFGLANWPDA